MSDTSEDTTPSAAERFELPSAGDELHLAFPNSPGPRYGMDPKDNLPKPIVPASIRDAEAPLLDLDKFICMADKRSFVLRSPRWGDVLAVFKPAEVKLMPNGDWAVPTDLAVERLPEKYRNEAALCVIAGEPYPRGARKRRKARRVDPESEENEPIPNRAIVEHATETFADDEWTAVDPVRPACRKYARQLMDFPEDRDAKKMYRLCTSRRTDSGEFLSVGDSRVYGCELRNPPYMEAVQFLDESDDKRLEDARRAAERQSEVFDVDTELENQEDEG